MGRQVSDSHNATMTVSRNQFFWLSWTTAHWEWVLALLCLPVAFVLFEDFGLTWDASAHMEYGQRILSYYRGGFSDLSFLEMGNIRDKGPLFVLSSAFVHWLFGLAPGRLWNLLISLFAILILTPLPDWEGSLKISGGGLRSSPCSITMEKNTKNGIPITAMQSVERSEGSRI